MGGGVTVETYTLNFAEKCTTLKISKEFGIALTKQVISARPSKWALTYSEKDYHAEHR